MRNQKSIEPTELAKLVASVGATVILRDVIIGDMMFPEIEIRPAESDCALEFSSEMNFGGLSPEIHFVDEKPELTDEEANEISAAIDGLLRPEMFGRQESDSRQIPGVITGPSLAPLHEWSRRAMEARRLRSIEVSADAAGGVSVEAEGVGLADRLELSGHHSTQHEMIRILEQTFGSLPDPESEAIEKIEALIERHACRGHVGAASYLNATKDGNGHVELELLGPVYTQLKIVSGQNTELLAGLENALKLVE